MLDKIKNLSKQTLIYGTSTIFGRFLNFILVPFYTNVFLPSEYGIFSVIFAGIAFLNIFFSLGLESGYFKFASTLEAGDEKQNFSLPFLTILINSAVLSAIIFLFAGDIAVLSGFGTNYTEIIRYASLILFFDALVLVPFAFLRLHNKAKIFAAVKITGIVVNVALNFILVIEFKLGVAAVFIGNLAASIITFILLFKVVYNNLSFRFNRKLFDELLKFSLPYVPAGLASIMVQVISRPILLYLTDEATVGIFQANFKLGIFMMLIVSMFEYAWRPFFLNNANEQNAKEIFSKVMLLFVGITSVVLITLTYFIEDIIKIPLSGRGYLIGSKYWSGVYIVPVVLFGYLIYGIYINLMAGIYIEKKTKYLPYITGLGALINICGNFILIPSIGSFGAALSSFLSYLAMTVYIYKVSQRFYPVAFDINKIYIINCVNIIALVIFYLSYFDFIPINFLIKILLILTFIIPVIFISGIWKIKYLFTNY